jgi:hypothetical protein
VDEVVEGEALGKAAEFVAPGRADQAVQPGPEFVVGAEGVDVGQQLAVQLPALGVVVQLLLAGTVFGGQLLALGVLGGGVFGQVFVAGVAERLAAQLGQAFVGGGAKGVGAVVLGVQVLLALAQFGAFGLGGTAEEEVNSGASGGVAAVMGAWVERKRNGRCSHPAGMAGKLGAAHQPPWRRCAALPGAPR